LLRILFIGINLMLFCIKEKPETVKLFGKHFLTKKLTDSKLNFQQLIKQNECQDTLVQYLGNALGM
jgi:hypothetical protein